VQIKWTVSYLFWLDKAHNTLEDSLAIYNLILKLLNSRHFNIRNQLHDFIFHLFIFFLKLSLLASELANNVMNNETWWLLSTKNL
jgi:hypothetical protein